MRGRTRHCEAIVREAAKKASTEIVATQFRVFSLALDHGPALHPRPQEKRGEGVSQAQVSVPLFRRVFPFFRRCNRARRACTARCRRSRFRSPRRPGGRGLVFSLWPLEDSTLFFFLPPFEPPLPRLPPRSRCSRTLSAFISCPQHQNMQHPATSGSSPRSHTPPCSGCVAPRGTRPSCRRRPPPR